MSVVTKIVNLIAARPLHKREFSALLLEVDSTYSGLLMYNNVRWLSGGKVLERFVECFEEIKVFLDDKDLGNFPQLNDDKWVNTLMFFTDLAVHINELNLKLQGFDKSIDVMLLKVPAAVSVPAAWERDNLHAPQSSWSWATVAAPVAWERDKPPTSGSRAPAPAAVAWVKLLTHCPLRLRPARLKPARVLGA
ncbi:hypothetical protein QTO34_008217 [Cnephaeus nilssonii]|uniref:General transcription factor II-I repeat domain-containing protein 2A n=1 Tax=Cnephaeus nilssonii TaxID=3371016 RepID=A0AA40IA08_CNENI|nr:hypothetical protein QTO34_008217 [Eptesicus nilssonii]